MNLTKAPVAEKDLISAARPQHVVEEWRLLEQNIHWTELPSMNSFSFMLLNAEDDIMNQSEHLKYQCDVSDCPFSFYWACFLNKTHLTDAWTFKKTFLTFNQII